MVLLSPFHYLYTMRILTVEDNEINALLMDRLLSDVSFIKKHSIAENGERALALVQESDYDLVLMDINLGDGKMTGTEVMKELRKSDKYVRAPIYAVTCYALPGDEERFLSEGFSRYFSKPIDHKSLIRTIEELVS